ncbi:hypothetical protein PF004_g29068 [Phytophthora fragariae]|uniref:Secreted protein n=1 Tax=Phytophthora fragariae TaxID=53985 RepID=A0A6G0MFU3_9STRA|nr:hypothetical protein PF004_g29068 [Phytophthora fragariae]
MFNPLFSFTTGPAFVWFLLLRVSAPGVSLCSRRLNYAQTVRVSTQLICCSYQRVHSVWLKPDTLPHLRKELPHRVRSVRVDASWRSRKTVCVLSRHAPSC